MSRDEFPRLLPAQVCFVVDDVDAAPVSSLGAAIETHDAFPNRANVEFVQVLGEGDSALPLGGASFVTGDQCALGPDVEQAEVQLWIAEASVARFQRQVAQAEYNYLFPHEMELMLDEAGLRCSDADRSSIR